MSKKRVSKGPSGPAFNPKFSSDREALIRTLIAEAAGEGVQGMKAVGFNLRNRADANYGGYGNSIAEQALGRKKGSNFGEYSSWNPRGKPSNAGKNALKVSENSPTYKAAAEAADAVLGRMEPDITEGSSNYRNSKFSSKKSNSWFNKLENKIDIGHHTFGRAPGFKVPEQNTQFAMGDKAQLAMRGDTPSNLSDVMVAALEKAQPTQIAKSEPAWMKTQATQIASAKQLPPSDTLPRINPNDRSGPLLPKEGSAPPTQLASVSPRDFGRGVPNSGMSAPPLNPKLDAIAPTQLASLGERDFARGVPNSKMSAPPLNPSLDRIQPPTQLASISPRDFGRGVPNSSMSAPSLNPRLTSPAAPTQLASVSPMDFGRGVPSNSMSAPSFNPRLTPPAAPTQLASVSPRDFGRGVPNSGMSAPPLNPALDKLQPPTQLASVSPTDFGHGIMNSDVQSPGFNPRLAPVEPPTKLAQLSAPSSPPTRPSRPEGLAAPSTSPRITPQRPINTSTAPTRFAQADLSPIVRHSAPRAPIEPVLREPGGNPAIQPQGGVEGFSSMSPVVAMNNYQQQPMQGGFDLASLFGDAFSPQQPQDQSFMMANNQFGGGGFWGEGSGGSGGFNLGSIFGSLFG